MPETEDEAAAQVWPSRRLKVAPEEEEAASSKSR